MQVSSLFVVRQKEKARVITNHSASKINDNIPREDAKVRYDDMKTFGQALHNARSTMEQGQDHILFKSDVASAFLNLPAHPNYQLRQLVVIDNVAHVVRRLVFGNCASPRIWCAVSSLMCWIAVNKLGISSLHVYMDNFFGFNRVGNLVWFEGVLRPRGQVLLLELWRDIGCPWEEKKQESGTALKIIGFWVDVVKGSISLSPDAIMKLMETIDGFLGSKDCQVPLRAWQQVAGYLNWSLNVMPWGRPALTEMYQKMSGKIHSGGLVPLNRKVREDLEWLKGELAVTDGVRFIGDSHWTDDKADMEIWTDAAPNLGLAFCYGAEGYVYKILPPSGDVVNIFFLEMMAILSAIANAASRPTPPRTILIHSDSLDSVLVLQSLVAHNPMHGAPLKLIAHIIMNCRMDLCIWHIAGKSNLRADLLLRLLFDEYFCCFPTHRVRYFEPPRHLLPTRWQQSF